MSGQSQDSAQPSEGNRPSQSSLKKPLLTSSVDHAPFKPSSASEQLHFFRQVLPVPCAFAVGIIFGGLAVLLLPWTLAKQSKLAQVGTPYTSWQKPYQMPLPPSEVPLAYYKANPLNNSCLIPRVSTLQVGKPQTFDACGFVIKSTDAVWNARGDVHAAIEKYFHADYVDAGSWGIRIIGKKELKNNVLSMMRAFPDIQIHITDCVCRGNDIDGYKCAMPDVLTGTNMGPSAYGPPTGNRAKWTGLVQSFVKRNPKTGEWQYFAEWGVHDEWSLIQQLGLDFSRIPHAGWNKEPLHDCFPLVDLSPGGASHIDQMDLMDQWLHHDERVHV